MFVGSAYPGMGAEVGRPQWQAPKILPLVRSPKGEWISLPLAAAPKDA